MRAGHPDLTGETDQKIRYLYQLISFIFFIYISITPFPPSLIWKMGKCKMQKKQRPPLFVIAMFPQNWHI